MFVCATKYWHWHTAWDKIIGSWRCSKVKKSISISIRVSEEELDKFKQAARLEAYASYSEFVRRTALIEAAKIIKKNENEGA